MSLNCGIVGLPNVGKSTLFSSLTAQQVAMDNYPFCTIEPNRGVVEVPDPRLYLLENIYKTGNVIPAIVEFVDIAGLVQGASQGEGLGNRFLAHIRELGLIIHVVRCFDDDDVAHVSGALDPVSDIEVVNLELALADLETIENRIEKNRRFMRSADKKVSTQAAGFEPVLERLREILSAGNPAKDLDIESGEQLADLHLITTKPVLYVGNVDEDDINGESDSYNAVRVYAEEHGAGCLPLCCKLEAEIAALESPEERLDFLESAGLHESGLNALVREAYKALGLQTFFTQNGKELRAWTIEAGETAPHAAGRIHTDFETGFIKAEVFHCTDIFDLGDVHLVREAGKLRIEGKDYVVQDGDVVQFRFAAHG